MSFQFDHLHDKNCLCRSCLYHQQDYGLTELNIGCNSPGPISDSVNKPYHYTQGKIEVIDFIEDQKLNYHEGQIIKYVCRANHKGNYLQDLKKAQWYLNRLINNIENV